MDLCINDFIGLQAWKEKKWVVLTPTGKSEIGDILMEADPYELALQIFGGLEKSRIMVVTENEGKARKIAAVLLAIQDVDFTMEDIVKAVRES